MKYARKIIQCGKMRWIREDPTPALGKNHTRPPSINPTTEEQMKLNDRHVAQKLAMIIQGNFVPNKDLFLTLTHEVWIDEINARKAIRKFHGLMRKYYKAKGLEYRYIVVTEKQGCWHHHLIVENIPLDTIREFWKQATEGMRRKEENRVVISPLDDSDKYKRLTEYLVNPEKPSRKKDAAPDEAENAKTPRRKGGRRYSTSKNLEKLIITPQVINRISKSAPKPPKGYQIESWSKWCDSWGDMHAEYTCVWVGDGKSRKAQRRDYTERKRE